MQSIMLPALLGLMLAVPAPADDASTVPSDDAVLHPYQTTISGIDAALGGSVLATLLAPVQPSAESRDATVVSGAAVLSGSLKRTGEVFLLSLETSLLLYRDRYYFDDYDNDFVQKIYGRIETDYGTFEAGMTDGAAFALALGGPAVDAETSPEGNNVVFFRDPSCGGMMTDRFAFNSTVEASFNFAKFAYYTPEWSGLQFGVSYAPSEAKNVLPYLSAGPEDENRQAGIWEVAARYNRSIGALSAGFHVGAGFAHAVEHSRTSGRADLAEWAAGGEFAYAPDDDLTLSWGGAYHRGNGYAFDIDEALTAGQTDSAHLSTKLETGRWAFGAEYNSAAADGGDSVLRLLGLSIAVGYALDVNLSATLGWQRLRYASDREKFYNGKPRIALNAVYLHLHFEMQP